MSALSDKIELIENIAVHAVRLIQCQQLHRQGDHFPACINKERFEELVKEYANKIY